MNNAEHNKNFLRSKSAVACPRVRPGTSLPWLHRHRKQIHVLALFVATLVARGQTIEVLHAFQGADGWGPYCPLVQGTDGNFYGTTVFGGGVSLTNVYGLPAGSGTVFRMTPEGALTTLVSIESQNSFPPGVLVLGNDGEFYGTTGLDLSPNGDGGFGYGTVFRLTRDGALSTLVAFKKSDGSGPNALVQGKDGSLYGTTKTGGNLSLQGGSGSGTVYKVTTTGMLTTLVKFNDINGSFPQGIVQGQDGNFYGTTLFGGAYGMGTFFKVTPSGALTTLRSFNFNPWATAQHGVVQGNDGNFYGVTNPVSESYPGTVFRMTPAGLLTTLFSFDREVGYPSFPPIQAKDGNLYGTTGFFFRTESFQGVVYKITPDGTTTTLLSLDGLDTAYGVSLALGSDGNLYGTATGSNRSIDDGYGPGAIFRVVLPTLPRLNIVRSGDSLVISWSATAADAILETVNSFPGQTWSTAQTGPLQIGDQEVVTLDITSDNQFFRLRAP
jgi:uncharacterized repeat protein (TIGR03803 family)